MKKHIDRYLKKAHLESVGKNVKSRIDFKKFLTKMAGIFKKLYPSKKIIFNENFDDFFVFGSLEDMEEVI